MRADHASSEQRLLTFVVVHIPVSARRLNERGMVSVEPAQSGEGGTYTLLGAMQR